MRTNGVDGARTIVLGRGVPANSQRPKTRSWSKGVYEVVIIEERHKWFAKIYDRIRLNCIRPTIGVSDFRVNDYHNSTQDNSYFYYGKISTGR